MSNELQIAFNEIAQMRALPSDIVLEALQSALVSAYRKDTGASAAQAIEAEIDPITGRAKVYVEKEVVDDVFSDSTEVTLERARFFNPEAQINDIVMVQVDNTTRSFGRIAAQTAKQVILQKIREAERNSLYDEFINREGDLITGTVQSVNSRKVTLSLGRAEADLPRAQQIPGERYRTHEKIRVYVVEVVRSNRGPQILVSRAHRNMLRRLLEYEVPEIYNGQVEIKNIAREAGHRSKVAVAALQDGIDPVGACVGMRGIRIQNIVKELHNEKIDVIEWNTDAVAFISKALSPARVTGVYLDDDPIDGKTAVVLVPDDQLSLAIGREGQNARLAAKLTGWRIDIKSVAETVQNALDELESEPLRALTDSYADLIAESMRIMEKKQHDLAIMPEEYKTLGRLADAVEHLLQEKRDAAREVYLQKREAIRETLAPKLFELPLDVLAVSQEMLDILEPFENVGEVMLTSLVNDEAVKRKLAPLAVVVEVAEPVSDETDAVADTESEAEANSEAEAESEAAVELEAEAAEASAEAAEATDAEVEEEAPVLERVDPMVELQAALDIIMAADIDKLLEEAISIEDTDEEEEEALAEAEAELAADAESDASEADSPAEQPASEDGRPEVMVDAFGQPIVAEVEAEAVAAVPLAPDVDVQRDVLSKPDKTDAEEQEVDDEESEREFELDLRKGKLQRRKDRQKRRQLVLDEQSGEVIAKRRRKGGRGSWDEEAWEDYDF
ncbi:MAG: transcription termination/antitermination protein NusA [Anaerolineae bacterium]|nr:transcription termination/antitermination protein NusA [Anaerolineae bacterium]